MATAVTIDFLCILWFSGYPARHFAWVIAVGVVVFGVLAVAFAYRFERIRTYLDTFRGDFSNPQGAAYQSYQGMLSLADGGLFGVGLGQSSAKWFYLPEATNDFIFAIIGEELGLTAVIAVVLCYGLIVERALRAALICRDAFGKLIAAGLGAVIAIQVFVVIGGVTGLIPLTGLTTPFLSYGGSSLVANWAIIGLILRISDQARRPPPLLDDSGSPDSEDTQVVRTR